MTSSAQSRAGRHLRRFSASFFTGTSTLTAARVRERGRVSGVAVSTLIVVGPRVFPPGSKGVGRPHGHGPVSPAGGPAVDLRQPRRLLRPGILLLDENPASTGHLRATGGAVFQQ